MKREEITPEMAEQLGAEYRKLIEQAQEQLTQHRLWLRLQLCSLGLTETGLDAEQRAQLVEEAGLIKLEMVRLEPSLKEGEKQTVTAVYEYPDALHAFLSRADISEALSIPAQGGMTLDTNIPSIKV